MNSKQFFTVKIRFWIKLFLTKTGFGVKISQRFKFWIKTFITCQTLNQTFRQAYDFGMNILQRVRFWVFFLQSAKFFSETVCLYLRSQFGLRSTSRRKLKQSANFVETSWESCAFFVRLLSFSTEIKDWKKKHLNFLTGWWVEWIDSALVSSKVSIWRTFLLLKICFYSKRFSLISIL